MSWNEVGVQIKDRRDQLGLTQEQLAAKSDVSTATIRKLERGRPDGEPQASTLAGLSRALWRRADTIQRMLVDGATPAVMDDPGVTGLTGIDLSEEEWERVVEYAKFLRSQREQ